jgi:hypothetical protein
MKTSSLSLALGGTLLAGWLLTGPALAQTQRPSIPLGGEYKPQPLTPQQLREKTAKCNSAANRKKLSGSQREDYLKSCMDLMCLPACEPP